MLQAHGIFSERIRYSFEYLYSEYPEKNTKVTKGII
jgi:hypothetical protein